MTPDLPRLWIKERKSVAERGREQIGPLGYAMGLRGNASSGLGGKKDVIVFTKSKTHTIIPGPHPHQPQCPNCDGAIARIEMEAAVGQEFLFAAYCENGHRWEPAWSEDELELLGDEDRIA